ncbi:hypothetical protein BGZ99_003155 [Dissophora globulifera]|uniref:Uncharacterized protein n=1 Tax=Dissophora globulifera TaxID=979702 RepID=A0A9P6RN54_9FUNG|nr:hypothetical protein BGZ99_003155 [Dissophora globulifera]
MKFSLTIASIALFIAATSKTATEAAPVSLATVTGQTAALISASQYCIFLPPKKGGNIADNEDKAVAFCNKAISTAPKAGILPTGFIKSIHFVHDTTKNYVQITGKIDRSKYSLSASDGGGQYDMKAPVGSHCAGYTSFVQLIEPDEQIYCLRCCKNKADCPTNKSTKGCKAVLGGSYS